MSTNQVITVTKMTIPESYQFVSPKDMAPDLYFLQKYYHFRHEPSNQTRFLEAKSGQV